MAVNRSAASIGKSFGDLSFFTWVPVTVDDRLPKTTIRGEMNGAAPVNWSKAWAGDRQLALLLINKYDR